jgi:hypothetical protein
MLVHSTQRDECVYDNPLETGDPGVQALPADSDQAMYSHKQLSKKVVINH